MSSRSVIWSTIGILAAVVGSVLAVNSKGTPDSELGLSRGSVFEVPEPPREIENSSEPGDGALTPRDFPQQPSLVPHGIEDLLPISFRENQCVDCHAVEEKIEGEATPIPPSHYIDYRNDPELRREEVAGARYNCIACHLSPGLNPPLVENAFSTQR